MRAYKTARSLTYYRVPRKPLPPPAHEKSRVALETDTPPSPTPVTIGRPIEFNPPLTGIWGARPSGPPPPCGIHHRSIRRHYRLALHSLPTQASGLPPPNSHTPPCIWTILRVSSRVGSSGTGEVKYTPPCNLKPNGSPIAFSILSPSNHPRKHTPYTGDAEGQANTTQPRDSSRPRSTQP